MRFWTSSLRKEVWLAAVSVHCLHTLQCSTPCNDPVLAKSSGVWNENHRRQSRNSIQANILYLNRERNSFSYFQWLSIANFSEQINDLGLIFGDSFKWRDLFFLWWTFSKFSWIDYLKNMRSPFESTHRISREAPRRAAWVENTALHCEGAVWWIERKDEVFHKGKFSEMILIQFLLLSFSCRFRPL